MDYEKVMQEVRRLSGLNGFPRNIDGLRSLVEAFSSLDSFERVQAIVADILRNEDHCPKPATIWAEVQAHRVKQTKLAIRCFQCYDTGITTSEFLVAWQNGRREAQRLTAEEAVTLWRKHAEAEGEAQAAKEPETAALIRKSRCFELNRQMIYEAAVPCDCRQPIPPPVPARLPYRDSEAE